MGTGPAGFAGGGGAAGLGGVVTADFTGGVPAEVTGGCVGDGDVVGLEPCSGGMGGTLPLVSSGIPMPFSLVQAAEIHEEYPNF